MKQVIKKIVGKMIVSSPTGASLSNKELKALKGLNQLKKMRSSSPTGGSIKKRTKPLKK